jgi:hypothetical protein
MLLCKLLLSLDIVYFQTISCSCIIQYKRNSCIVYLVVACVRYIVFAVVGVTLESGEKSEKEGDQLGGNGDAKGAHLLNERQPHLFSYFVFR